jgi:hypothetical protein
MGSGRRNQKRAFIRPLGVRQGAKADAALFYQLFVACCTVNVFFAGMAALKCKKKFEGYF